MFMIDEEAEEQLAYQSQMEALKEHLQQQNQPTQITFMVQEIHCWPIFPVIPYVAAIVFGISPEELRQMCSQKVDTQKEESQK